MNRTIPKTVVYYGIFLILFWTLVGVIPFYSPDAITGFLSLQYYGSIMGVIYMWGIQNIVMSIIMAVALVSHAPRFLAWMFVMRLISELLNLIIWLSERTIALGSTLVTVEVKSVATSSILSTSSFGGLMLVIPILLILFLIPEYLCARTLFKLAGDDNNNYRQLIYAAPYYELSDAVHPGYYFAPPVEPSFDAKASPRGRQVSPPPPQVGSLPAGPPPNNPNLRFQNQGKASNFPPKNRLDTPPYRSSERMANNSVGNNPGARQSQASYVNNQRTFR